ncbi:MAG: Gfo/Idh/MocA family oxidoreductase [Clostridia bacterium]|nr:Gfo/Idh/MocA family oxidoreductase [Clostridia bacterium]
MKTIGFVDYYISEWHANNYPVWLKQICEETGDDFVVKYAWAEEYVSPVDGRNTDEWCEKFGVERCQTIEELCEKADYIVVLSPSNPEKHLEYAEKVFPFGKRTYIDKTFAPDLATAEKIYACAEQYGVKFFSSSALRFAMELDELKGSRALVTTGGGASVEEYIIHQVEMAVKVMQSKAVSLRVENQDAQYFIRVKFEDGKQATMIFASMAFAVSGQSAVGGSNYLPCQSPYFMNLLKDILRFFKTGELSFPAWETLEVMRIREAIIKGKDKLGEWITL